MVDKYSKEHVQHSENETTLVSWLLSYLKPYKGLTCISVFCLLIAKIIEAAVPVFIGSIAQKIITGSTAISQKKSEILGEVAEDAVLIIFALLIAYFFEVASLFIKNWIGQKAIYKLRTEVYEHIIYLYTAYFDKSAVGRLLTRTIHDVDQINQMMTESVIPIMGSFFLFLFMSIGIIYLDWRIAVVFALILPVIVWLTNRFRYYQSYCYDKLRTIVSAMNTFLQEYLMGASTIRNFGLQKKERQLFNEVNEDFRVANMETIHHFAFFIAGIDLLQAFSLITVFVALVWLAPEGFAFQVGTFFTFSLYALMFFRPLADLAERYNVLQSAISAAQRVYNILKQPTEPYEDEEEVDLKEIETIEFDHVWFAYNEENWVLKGMSFTIQRGESIALVGITGAGKTTIFNLLLRLYDFQKGAIRINGKDIRQYPLHALRRSFSTVLQDPVLFSGTIHDNITLFQSDFNDERIHEVMKYVNLEPLLKKFKNGLFHTLTSNGKGLSMGEMQLLTLARAVAHKHSVLMLDEATANIDSSTEQMIQDALKRILKNKTAIVIAHRLSTIKDVNKILVLNNGIVVESGTHQELIDRKGIYEKLYRITL